MSGGKDAGGFFRKVVNFVVNPRAAEPVDSGSSDAGLDADDLPDSGFGRSELKAMIERKRRNDFVRKRELDTLRKLRRDGLTPEQLAVLGASPGMADTQPGEDPGPVADPGMKARIDAIEQQMASHVITPAAPAARAAAATPREAWLHEKRKRLKAGEVADTESDAFARSMADTIIDSAQLDAAMSAGLAGGAAARPSDAPPSRHDPAAAPAVEVTEVAHDPELDEAVISYANGDSAHAEGLLVALIREGGSRRDHPETWMVIFDLYRATGEQARFEALAAEFAERFSRSAPQWFSVPQMVAEAAAANRPAASRIDGNVSWTCPRRVDAAAVEQLRLRVRNAPLPWVIDWTELAGIEPEALDPLLALFGEWAPRNIDMRWFGGEILLRLLADATPAEKASVDARLWRLRLLVLRMANRPERFDEVAIDYCVTYEISPPSWEPAACRVRISGPVGAPTQLGATSVIGDPSTRFVESSLAADGMLQVARLELTGQLVGDIDSALERLDQQVGACGLVELSCLKLLRVDFMASGELLNWVLAHTREQRRVSFIDTNRLVARFFSAIGIDAHASVSVRAV